MQLVLTLRLSDIDKTASHLCEQNRTIYTHVTWDPWMPADSSVYSERTRLWHRSFTDRMLSNQPRESTDGKKQK